MTSKYVGIDNQNRTKTRLKKQNKSVMKTFTIELTELEMAKLYVYLFDHDLDVVLDEARYKFMPDGSGYEECLKIIETQNLV